MKPCIDHPSTDSTSFHTPPSSPSLIQTHSPPPLLYSTGLEPCYLELLLRPTPPLPSSPPPSDSNPNPDSNSNSNSNTGTPETPSGLTKPAPQPNSLMEGEGEEEGMGVGGSCLGHVWVGRRLCAMGVNVLTGPVVGQVDGT